MQLFRAHTRSRLARVLTLNKVQFSLTAQILFKFAVSLVMWSAEKWSAPGRLPGPGQFCFESLQVARYHDGQHFLEHEVGHTSCNAERNTLCPTPPLGWGYHPSPFPVPPPQPQLPGAAHHGHEVENAACHG